MNGNNESRNQHTASTEEAALAGTAENGRKSWLEVFSVSAKLGLTSFGGPIAHLAYFHDEYVRRRKWLDERTYADLVALCQFLPGPASSQVGIGIGIMRAGLSGGLAAFIGFTFPSAVALILFAFLLHGFDVGNAGWIHGLKIVAVAIVAHAVWGMGQKLAPDRGRATIAIGSAVAAVTWTSAIAQVIVIAAAAAAGLFLYKRDKRACASSEAPEIRAPISQRAGMAALVLFFALLMVLPVIQRVAASHWLAVFDSFYRSGSLVFGGGHVVLPLLERETVSVGWISKELFLAGYGAAQAVPGPLFTFASYLGAVMGGWTGAAITTAAIFLPAFLLVAGAMPFWDELRRKPGIQGALLGVNASVVGILLAALYNPIWTSSIRTPADFALAAVLFGMLQYWKCPPWLVVIAGALGGTLIAYF